MTNALIIFTVQCYASSCGCGHMFVYLSVTCQQCTKIAKCRIQQTTLHNRPWILDFWCQTSWWNSNGTTNEDTK